MKLLPVQLQCKVVTNKAEAKNEIIKGVKQGKWIEYLDGNLNKTLSQDSANYYKLIIYKNGMIMETERIYNIEDVLYSENFYVDGKIEGTSKIFYNDGDILSEVPYKEGLKEGIAKSYNGIKGVSSEMPYSKGLMHGIAKLNSEGLITS